MWQLLPDCLICCKFHEEKKKQVSTFKASLPNTLRSIILSSTCTNKASLLLDSWPLPKCLYKSCSWWVMLWVLSHAYAKGSNPSLLSSSTWNFEKKVGFIFTNNKNIFKPLGCHFSYGSLWDQESKISQQNPTLGIPNNIPINQCLDGRSYKS